MRYSDCVNKLRENKDLEFICNADNYLVKLSLDKNGRIRFEDMSNGVDCFYMMRNLDEYEWRVGLNPVSFMEAINIDKKIMSVAEIDRGFQTIDLWLYDLSYAPIADCRAMMNGKWIIEEEWIEVNFLEAMEAYDLSEVIKVTIDDEEYTFGEGHRTLNFIGDDIELENLLLNGKWFVRK